MAAATSLSNGFNMHSTFMTVMNVSMFGMTGAMVSDIAGEDASPGDWVVQSALMIGAYALTALTTGLPVGMDTLSNLFNGQWAPTSYDMGAMHSMEEEMHDMNNHATAKTILEESQTTPPIATTTPQNASHMHHAHH